MRANRGFTLLEVMLVVVIMGVVAALVIWQGRSARQAAGLAGGAYDLALRIGTLKARAMADGREYLLVVTDTANPAGCKEREILCGRVLTFRNPTAFAVAGFNPDPPFAGVDFFDDGGPRYLPRNSQFDLASTWRPPAPFDAVTAFDGTILATCAGGQRCFALRFRPDGEVRPELLGGAPATPPGFAFVLRPFDAPSGAAERRGIFVSFTAGIVKTAAF